ncbi:MAG: DUF502 domain-containing protein [Bacteroidales bacterium]|nr:DUF502 domain-containing protein [Bacteroidales bacterium]
MKKIFRFLLQGILFIAPLGITVYFLYLGFKFIDGLLQEWLYQILNIRIPGLGLVAIILLLILIGFLGQTFIARPFKAVFNKLFKKIPILKVIYSAFSDLFSAFIGKEKKFNKPVVVNVNRELGLDKLGFMTENDLSLINEKGKVAVYFPHSYNWSGELFLVPSELVREIDVPAGDVMKFIVSAGVADWD